MPSAVSTVATTRSMTRNGSSTASPISKAVCSSETMNAGTAMRSGTSSALAGRGSSLTS